MIFISGIIFDIKKFAIHDGKGIRTTVFLKGCSMECWWCQNPESQKLEPEEIKKPRSRITDTTPLKEKYEIIGKQVSVSEVMKEIEKDMIFYEESDGGITFSGGEALMQPEFLKELLEACKLKGIHTILDTSGFSSIEIIKEIAALVDVFLYDLKIADNERHKKYTGVSNEQIKNNLIELSKMGKKIILRIPIIPGFTDDKENMEELGRFICSLEQKHEVSLLPYNQLGEEKYRRLNKCYNEKKEKCFIMVKDSILLFCRNSCNIKLF